MTATPNTTVANQNVTWNGTLTAVNGYSGSVTLTLYGGRSGDVRDHAVDGDADSWGRSVYGDAGQRDGRDV